MTTLAANLDDKVRETLRNKILTGGLGGGAHLSELKLSKEFNVSRTPIREALCALAADGLVEMVPHRGAFVRERTAATETDQKMVFGSLMAMSTRIAVEKAGIEGMMELEKSITSLDGLDESAFRQVVETILATIRKMADSPMLDELMSLTERRLQSGDTTPSGNMADLKQDFTFLLGAIKRGKAEAAEKTMRQIMGVATAKATITETKTLN